MDPGSTNSSGKHVWILWEWSVGRRDQSVIGIYSSWESAREEANRRRLSSPGKEHDWEEWELRV